jgi:hypothetical protein
MQKRTPDGYQPQQQAPQAPPDGEQSLDQFIPQRPPQFTNNPFAQMANQPMDPNVLQMLAKLLRG